MPLNVENTARVAPLSDCLRIMAARLSDQLAPAEKVEVEAAAALLELAYPALRELCHRIEKCGASIELTNAVILASDLAQAIGNKWNRRDEHAAERVRKVVPTDG